MTTHAHPGINSLLSYMTVAMYYHGTQSGSTRDRLWALPAACVTIATCHSLSQAYKQVVNDTSVFKLDLPSSRAKTPLLPISPSDLLDYMHVHVCNAHDTYNSR